MRRRLLQVLVLICLSLPLALLENAVLGWTGDQIAKYFGWSNPTIAQVLDFSWNYGVPLALSGAILLMYHATVNSRWYRTWTHQEPAPQVQPEPLDAFIPMREASNIAYEQLRQTKSIYAMASEKLGYAGKDESRADAILSWFSYLITPKIPVYGKHPPSRQRELIDKAEFKRSGFVNGGSAMRYRGEKESRYVDLEVRKTDLERLIEKLKNTRIEEPPEDGNDKTALERGYNKAAFERNRSNKDAAILRLAQLRSEGVRIRNEAEHVQDDDLQTWLGKVDTWMHEVIDTIRPVNEVDSEWYKTLDIVPPARVHMRVSFANQSHASVFIRIYNQHDYRLVRLDELLKKYRGTA